jgi:sugar lactone lactonase YvrE
MRRRVAMAALVGTLASVGAWSPTAGADVGVAPTFKRTLGGAGHADAYPVGVDVGPSGEVVLADVSDGGAVKFDASGRLVWRMGGLFDDAASKDDVRDVALDSHGNVYLSGGDWGRNVIELAPDGHQLRAWGGPNGDAMGAPSGISVHLANGVERVYVADTGKKRIRVFDTAGNQLRTILSPANCPFGTLRDVDADAAGNVYVANDGKNDVVTIRPDGTATCFGTKGTRPGQFTNPYGIRVAVDPVVGRERLYVSESGANRLQVLELDGTPVKGAQFGHAGPATDDTGTFTTLRRVAVDRQGDVWGADVWGARAERFDRTATGWTYDAAARLGRPLPPPTATRTFDQVRGLAFFANGDLAAVDTVNQRIVEMTGQGAIERACGQRSDDPASIDWPRGVAVDRATGDLWITDTKQNRLQVWRSSDCGVRRTLGTAGSGSGQLARPSAIAIRQSDRLAFVADAGNGRVVAWDIATGAQVGSFASTTARNPESVAVLPNGDVLVGDALGGYVTELSTLDGKSFTVVPRYYGGGPTYLGEVGGVAGDGRVVYAADTTHSQVVVFDAVTGYELAAFGSVGGVQLDHPTALAVSPSGELFIADTGDDRIVVVAYPATLPADRTPPDATVAGPKAGQTFASVPVQIFGMATDDRAVHTVNVSIQDRVTNQWLNVGTRTWQAGMFRNPAALNRTDRLDASWNLQFNPATLGSGQYFVRVEAVDASGNVDPTVATARFNVSR